MDPLAHTLVGAALAATRPARRTPLATAALLIGANLPDADVLSYLAGEDAALGFRRGWTHGVLAAAVLPPLLAGGLLAWDRARRRRDPRRPPPAPGRLLALSALAVATHPLLDWLNTYGVRLLMPFDDRWFYGDALFIVDPWLWLLLGGTLFLVHRGAAATGLLALLGALATVMLLLAGSIVPAPARWAWVAGLLALALLRFRVTPRGRGERAAALGLGLAMLYVGLMTGASHLAAARVRAELRGQGIAGVEDLMVGPEPADPLSWDVVAALPAEYRHGKFRWLPTPALDLAPRAIPTGMAGAGAAAALGAPGIQGTLGWMRFPFVEVEESATGTTVYLLDARYVRGRTRGFGAAVIETAPGGVSWLHPRAEGRHAR